MQPSRDRIRSAVLIAVLGACGTEVIQPDAAMGTCPPYQVPPSTDLTQPAVSFRNQVIPIFHAACSSNLCHGSATAAAAGVFLGPVDSSAVDAAAIRRGLVGIPSHTLASMPLVTASDPRNSFLMHKMDADQCAFDCSGLGCGAQMPQDSSTPLPVMNRDTIRRWIAQGAEDN